MDNMTCFVMMPFRDYKEYPQNHFRIVYESIFIPAINDAGFKAYRVDEDIICTSIIDKVFKALQQSEIALCDLSCCNPNVMYELGVRQAFDKPVVLVKDEKTESIFDVSGISTIIYQSSRVFESVMDARLKISKALKDTYYNQGKYDSIIKYAKIKEANYNKIDINSNEVIEIMFKQILDEISSLRETSPIHDIYNIYSNTIGGRYKLSGINDYRLFSERIDDILNNWKNNEIQITKEEYCYLEEILEWTLRSVKSNFSSSKNILNLTNLFRKKIQTLHEIDKKKNITHK